MTDHLPTLGVWGPKPSDASGVARYITDSRPHLDRTFRTARCGMRQSPLLFDQVLYHLGNNGMHHGAFRALAHRPGPVILHEFNTLNYYYEAWDLLPAYEQRAVLGLLSTALHHPLPTRADLDRYLAAHPGIDPETIDARIESLAISRATTVLVHSEGTAALLRERYPQADIRHIQFPVTPIPDRRTATRARHAIPPSVFLFGTFGFLGAYKRVDKIIQAWQSWPDRPSNALLVLGGEQRDGLVIPHDPTIRHTGWVPDGDFEDLLLAADCAIQLRGPWLGETSGPASILAAHGRPVIHSDLPAMHAGPHHPRQLAVPAGPAEIPALIEAMRTQYHLPRIAPAYDSAYSWSTWTEQVTAVLTPGARS